MTRETRAGITKSQWVEILTAAGVIVSVLFVAIQIRANTSAVRGSTMQGIADQSIEVTLALVNVAELRSAYGRALAGHTDDLSPEENLILMAWYGAALRVAENRFRQKALGTFTGASEAFGGVSPIYRVPYFKLYWASRRGTYPADFAAYVDTVLIPLVAESAPFGPLP